MAQQYRKKPRTKSSSQRSGFLTAILLAFASGYITASIFDADSLRLWFNRSLQHLKSPPREGTHAVHQTAELPKPKFEFYTLLSKERSGSLNSNSLPSAHPLPSAEVREMSKAIQAKVKEASPLPPIAQTKSRHYDVQLASYNKKSDAERLKATLLLKDFEAHIQQIDRPNGHWFRVVIGPFASMKDAEKAQLSIARSEHVMGIIRRLEA